MNPFNGPRHRGPVSNTIISGAIFGLLIILTVWSDSRGDPPDYLVGLLGVASTTFFGAIAGDKAARDKDVARVAKRAEAKADRLGEVAEHEHPGAAAAYDEHVEREREEGGPW